MIVYLDGLVFSIQIYTERGGLSAPIGIFAACARHSSWLWYVGKCVGSQAFIRGWPTSALQKKIAQTICSASSGARGFGIAGLHATKNISLIWIVTAHFCQRALVPVAFRLDGIRRFFAKAGKSM